MKITLRQLEVFDAIATLGSLSSAADRLGMSVSAASSAINDFQIVLGRPLFAHAKGKPLQITDEGRRLQPTIRSVLSRLQDIEAGEDVPLQGKLLVGATAMIAEHMLPRICCEFLSHHPEIQIQIEAASSISLFERLSRFEIETALVENVPEADGIELTKWRPDELWLVVSPAHALAQRGKLAIADLVGQRWCMREMRSTTAFRLRSLLYEELGQLPIAVEATSNEALRQAAICGAGIACLPRVIVKDDLADGKLVRLDVAGFRFSRALSLARPKNMWRSRIATAFETFLLDNCNPEPAHWPVRPPFGISERAFNRLADCADA